MVVLHYTTVLHFITLHYTSLNCIPLYYAALRCITLHSKSDDDECIKEIESPEMSQKSRNVPRSDSDVCQKLKVQKCPHVCQKAQKRLEVPSDGDVNDVDDDARRPRSAHSGPQKVG